jgi:hypothetical protein
MWFNFPDARIIKFFLSPLGPIRMIHEQRFSAFFYGTLLHPKILKRVIGNDGSHLEICPAVLLVSVVDVLFGSKNEQNFIAVRHLGPY